MQSQDPDQQRNLLLAVVLSMAVLLGWQLFYAAPRLKDEQARLRAQQQQSQTTAPKGTATEPGAKAPITEGAVPGIGPDAGAVARGLAQVFAAACRSRRRRSGARSP